MMGRAKEMWMDAVEAEAERLMEEEGLDEEEAWERAENGGDNLLADRLADIGDMGRQRVKDAAAEKLGKLTGKG